MSREKEPKITISKEAALLISDKEECEKLLKVVREAIYRVNHIITRRQTEVERLSSIEGNLQQRLEFLTIVPVIEPNTWYLQRGTHPKKDSCLILTSQNNILSGWQFSIENNEIPQGWQVNDYVFLHPLTNELITEPPKNELRHVIVDRHIGVSWHSYYLKGSNSFLLNWTPSSDLGVVVQDPDIIEVRGILDEMWVNKNSRCLQKSDNNGKSSLHFVKYQKQWYLLLMLE